MMTVELIICVWGLPKTALRRDKRAGFKHITSKSSLEGKQATQRSLPTKPGMGTRWVAPQKHSMRLVEGPEAMSQLSKEIHARGPLPCSESIFGVMEGCWARLTHLHPKQKKDEARGAKWVSGDLKNGWLSFWCPFELMASCAHGWLVCGVLSKRPQNGKWEWKPSSTL